jgi:hypothetical protein
MRMRTSTSIISLARRFDQKREASNVMFIFIITRSLQRAQVQGLPREAFAEVLYCGLVICCET